LMRKTVVSSRKRRRNKDAARTAGQQGQQATKIAATLNCC